MNLKSEIESVLFLQGEPVAADRIAKITSAPKKAVEQALAEIVADYADRGIVLIEQDGKWQFATHPQNRGVVKKLRTAELSGELSKSSLEVLAIISYRGPVSRAAIDYIRGVNSSSALRTLAIRGLIERSENPKDKRSFLYRVGTDFLKHLGLRKISELPEYDTLRKVDIPEPPLEEGESNAKKT